MISMGHLFSVIILEKNITPAALVFNILNKGI